MRWLLTRRQEEIPHKRMKTYVEENCFSAGDVKKGRFMRSRVKSDLSRFAHVPISNFDFLQRFNAFPHGHIYDHNRYG